jgi:hypothetical protein
LTDQTGAPLGHIAVSDGLVTLWLYTGGSSAIWASVYSDSSRVFVNCGGKGDMGITVGENRTDISDVKRGYVFGEWKDLTTVDNLRNLLLPSRGRRFDEYVPTEDLHLRNREGWVFASLGLSESGDAGIAIADKRGTVRLTCFERKALRDPSSEPEWWDLAVLDKSGRMRLSLQLRPAQVPDLVLYPNEIGEEYVLDFGSQKLKHRDDNHSSDLSWLPPIQTGPRGQIQFVDNRGRKLWGAP